MQREKMVICKPRREALQKTKAILHLLKQVQRLVSLFKNLEDIRMLVLYLLLNLYLTLQFSCAKVKWITEKGYG